MFDKAFEVQLHGWSLTTAEIMYRLPDHRDILQIFLWQEYDLAPTFPELKGFLDFWCKDIEGPLHSVRIVHQRLIEPREWRAVDGIISIH